MRRSCTIDFFGRSGAFPRCFVFAVRACACVLVLFAAVRPARPFSPPAPLECGSLPFFAPPFGVYLPKLLSPTLTAKAENLEASSLKP